MSTFKPRPNGVTTFRSFFSSTCWVLSPEPEPDRESSASVERVNTDPRLLLMLAAVVNAVVRVRRGIPMRGENAAVLAC